MHPKQREDILRRLNRIVREAKNTDLSKQIYPSRIIYAEEIGFNLGGETFKEYVDLGKLFLANDDWQFKFSEKHIYGALDHLLAKVLKDKSGSETGHYLDELITEFNKYSTELLVYTPMSGISMDMESFEIGNVVLRKGTDQFLEDLLNRVGSVIMKTQSSDEDKSHFKKKQEEIILSHKGKILGEYRVVAEHEKAIERAEEESRRIVELFWYSIPILYPSEDKVSVGLAGDVPIRPRQTPVISSDQTFYNLNSRWVGSPPFPLNAETVKRMEKMGTMELSEPLKKPALTDFEDTLLRAVHWYSAGRAQSESENGFLNLMICLETFLTPRDGSPIQNAIAEGVAIILGRGLEERKEIKAKIKTLYRTRSGVSHGGRKAVADTDLNWLKVVAWFLIRWIIEHKDQFKSQNDLLNWIEDEKLK